MAVVCPEPAQPVSPAILVKVRLVFTEIKIKPFGFFRVEWDFKRNKRGREKSKKRLHEMGCFLIFSFTLRCRRRSAKLTCKKNKSLVIEVR